MVNLLEMELISLLLVVGVSLFLIHEREGVKRLPQWRVLIASFAFLATGVLAAVVEAPLGEPWGHVLQHLTALLSSGCLALWAWTAAEDGVAGSDQP